MTKCFAQRALIGFYMLIPVFVLSFSGKLVAQSENIRRQPVEMAALHGELVWQRTSPTVQRPEGPVLYQILFRSSARPGFVPKIDSNFTLTNSLITEDNAGVHIGALAIAPTGAITLCCGQSFGAGGAGGTVTNIATGTGLTGGPITTSGTISIANGGVTTAQIGSGAAASGQVLTANGSGGAAWQSTPVAWALAGNVGTACATSPCTNFLGTTDNSSLEIRVEGNRAFRIEPATDNQFGFSPNIVGGFSGNAVIGPGVAGATIAGGGGGGDLVNTVSGRYGAISGGVGNGASGFAYAIAGGQFNMANGSSYPTVGGGIGNTASGANASTVAGGYQNTASGSYSAVAGGSGNAAVGFNATVAGGGGNTASGLTSIVAGGSSNTASASYSTVTGGTNNTASGIEAIVAGGANSTAGGLTSIVAGGKSNTASGDYSFAAGQHANTNSHSGSFVWGDASTTTDVTATADNQFVARTSGGVIFYTQSDLSTGVSVAAGGGSWSSLSDRNLKDNFTAIDAKQILARVIAMPVTTWNYKSQAASIRHIGPMAQDFYSAFQVGEDDRHITEIDESGVAFAAIQGLNQKLESSVEQLQAQLKNKDAQISAQQKQIELLEQQVRAVMINVEAIKRVSPLKAQASEVTDKIRGKITSRTIQKQ